MTPSAREALLTIVQWIVTKSSEVTVESRPDPHYGTVLTLTVAQSDMGRVIGQNGRMINDIRHFVGSIAMKNKAPVFIELTDPRLARNTA